LLTQRRSDAELLAEPFDQRTPASRGLTTGSIYGPPVPTPAGQLKRAGRQRREATGPTHAPGAERVRRRSTIEWRT
jgi:hypothetical protein